MSDTFASVPAEIPDDLIDQLLAGQPLTAAGITGPEGLLKQLTKRLVERAMGAELSDHLGYDEGETPRSEQENRRNGSSSKTLITEQGAVPIEIPRDRAGSFEPQIVAKHRRRFDGFDDKIIALYAGGMTTRQIEAQLRDLYGVELGRDLIVGSAFAHPHPFNDDIPILMVTARLEGVPVGEAVVESPGEFTNDVPFTFQASRPGKYLITATFWQGDEENTLTRTVEVKKSHLKRAMKPKKKPALSIPPLFAWGYLNG